MGSRPNLGFVWVCVPAPGFKSIRGAQFQLASELRDSDKLDQLLLIVNTVGDTFCTIPWRQLFRH